MRNKVLGVLALGCLAIASQARATPIDFNFGIPSGDQGLTHTYTAGSPSLSITATAFGTPAADLWGKNAGGDEVGLGLTNDSTHDHEIQVGKGFIQLDVMALFGKVSSLSTKFQTNSTTGGDAYQVFGSNTAGTLGTLVAAGGSEISQALPDFGTYRYYDFNASAGNYLISSITAQQNVPEPASFVILGAGLLGIGMMARRQA